jgi:hypothetical protein
VELVEEEVPEVIGGAEDDGVAEDDVTGGLEDDEDGIMEDDEGMLDELVSTGRAELEEEGIEEFDGTGCTPVDVAPGATVVDVHVLKNSQNIWALISCTSNKATSKMIKLIDFNCIYYIFNKTER